MAYPIFLDANIPFYAAGRPHPLKQPSLHVLSLVAAHQSAFITDAEVLQEILHRYLAIGAWPQGHTTFTGFAGLMRGRIEPMTIDDVAQAAVLAGQHRGLSARDLIHVAVMDRIGADTIVSADRGFNRMAHINRLDPGDVTTWHRRLGL